MSRYLVSVCVLFACLTAASSSASFASSDASSNISVTVSPDGSGYSLNVHGNVEPQDGIQSVQVYIHNAVPIPMQLGEGAVDANGFFNMTERYGNGLYFEGATMHLDVRYGDKTYDIWYPEKPVELLATLGAMEEKFCSDLSCETFHSWKAPTQQTYLKALYYKDCDTCMFDIYDVQVVDRRLVVYLEDTEKNKGVDRHMLEYVIGSGFGIIDIRDANQHKCHAARDGPECMLDVFEIDAMKKSAGPIRLMKVIPPELIDCKAGLYEIRKKSDPITPYCVKLDTIGKLYLRGWSEPESYNGILIMSLVRNKILADSFFIEAGGIPDTLNVYITGVAQSNPAKYFLAGHFDTIDSKYSIHASARGANLHPIQFSLDGGDGDVLR